MGPKPSKSEHYPVTRESMKYRVALLINNRTFDDPQLTRHGSEVDVEAMDQLLSQLGYKVLKYNNLNSQDIEKALQDFAKHPNLKSTDSVFVVLMSHGYLGKILGVDKSEFEIDKVYEILNNANCPALLHTPKVILVQASREDQHGSTSGSDLVRKEMVHLESDFTSLCSSTPHTKSYMDPEKGSLFIQKLVKVFNENHSKDHISELYRKVMREFDDYPWQMPTIERETLKKDLYLVPD